MQSNDVAGSTTSSGCSRSFIKSSLTLGPSNHSSHLLTGALPSSSGLTDSSGVLSPVIGVRELLIIFPPAADHDAIVLASIVVNPLSCSPYAMPPATFP